MAKTLSEFISQRAESYAAEAATNRELVAEWTRAVDSLLDQIVGWLAAADPTKVIEVKRSRPTVSEPGLGRYQAPRLDVTAFGKWIGVVPKARKTIRTVWPDGPGPSERATGRVDLTDDFVRHHLYRFSGADGDRWFIESPGDDDPRPLTREAFERAFLDYLS